MFIHTWVREFQIICNITKVHKHFVGIFNSLIAYNHKKVHSIIIIIIIIITMVFCSGRAHLGWPVFRTRARAYHYWSTSCSSATTTRCRTRINSTSMSHSPLRWAKSQTFHVDINSTSFRLLAILPWGEPSLKHFMWI